MIYYQLVRIPHIMCSQWILFGSLIASEWDTATDRTGSWYSTRHITQTNKQKYTHFVCCLASSRLDPSRWSSRFYASRLWSNDNFIFFHSVVVDDVRFAFRYIYLLDIFCLFLIVIDIVCGACVRNSEFVVYRLYTYVWSEWWKPAVERERKKLIIFPKFSEVNLLCCICSSIFLRVLHTHRHRI